MGPPPTTAWIDDQDKRVRYNGIWIRGGSVDEFNTTVSSSTRVGDSFIVPFYGQSILVFGTIDSTSEGVVTNYSIDGSPPVQMTSLRGVGDTKRQEFWVSPPLNITQHELTVTMAKLNPDPQPGEGTIWFDYFIVSDPSGHEAVAPKKLSKGRIAGIVVGSVAFVVVLILGAFLWRRRRRPRREEEAVHSYRNFGSHAGHDEEPRNQVREKRPERWNRHSHSQSVDSQSPRTLGGGRPVQTRNGIQPFVIGPSTPQNPPHPREMNSDTPEPSIATRIVKKKISAGTGVESNIGPSRSVQLRRSHSSFFASESNAATVVDPRESTALRSQSPVTQSLHTLRLMRSFGSHSSRNDSRNDSSPMASGPSNRHNRIRMDEAEEVSPEPIPASDRGDRGDHRDGDIGSIDHVHSIGSEPTSEHPHAEDLVYSRGPTIRITVADSVNTQRHTEEDAGEVDRAMVQHIDSGVRLTEEGLSLPVELPPVYSSS